MLFADGEQAVVLEKKQKTNQLPCLVQVPAVWNSEERIFAQHLFLTAATSSPLNLCRSVALSLCVSFPVTSWWPSVLFKLLVKILLSLWLIKISKIKSDLHLALAHISNIYPLCTLPKQTKKVSRSFQRGKQSEEMKHEALFTKKLFKMDVSTQYQTLTSSLCNMIKTLCIFFVIGVFIIRGSCL